MNMKVFDVPLVQLLELGRRFYDESVCPAVDEYPASFQIAAVTLGIALGAVLDASKENAEGHAAAVAAANDMLAPSGYRLVAVN
jgi:hypothetical protein